MTPMRVGGGAAVSVLACCAIVGWFTGWLVGASESPVVAALLPLVFGLLGALGFGFIEAKAQANRLLEVLTRPEPDLSSVVRQPPPSHGAMDDRLLMVWCIGVAIYCGTCRIGVEQGIGRRVPTYPSVEQMVGADLKIASASEMVQLHRLRLVLMRLNVAEIDTESVFKGPIRQFFHDPRYEPGGELADVRETSLRDLVTALVSVGAVPVGRGRGPADTGAP